MQLRDSLEREIRRADWEAAARQAAENDEHLSRVETSYDAIGADGSVAIGMGSSRPLLVLYEADMLRELSKARRDVAHGRLDLMPIRDRWRASAVTRGMLPAVGGGTDHQSPQHPSPPGSPSVREVVRCLEMISHFQRGGTEG